MECMAVFFWNSSMGRYGLEWFFERKVVAYGRSGLPIQLDSIPPFFLQYHIIKNETRMFGCMSLRSKFIAFLITRPMDDYAYTKYSRVSRTPTRTNAFLSLHIAFGKHSIHSSTYSVLIILFMGAAVLMLPGAVMRLLRFTRSDLPNLVFLLRHPRSTF
jgi:hypothetical protein